MKAIKIDVVKKEIYEIEIGKDFREIYKAIDNGCDAFCVPVTFDNNDSMFADDESLLREKLPGGFMMDDWNYPIVNNAIILGCDDEGESVDYKSDINDIIKSVRFIDEDACCIHRDKVLSTQPKLYF